MHTLRARIGATIAVLTVVSVAHAAAKSFDFKDPKGVNSVSFLLDSELEPIRGDASGISGELLFDPENPKATSGTIVVAAKSVETPNKKMTEYMHTAQWLDAEAHPEIKLTVRSVGSVSKESENRWTLMTKAEFTLKGKSKTFDVPLRITYLPGRAGDRMRGANGDLLVVRAEFKFNRSEFDVRPGYNPSVVAEEVLIRGQIVGMHRTE